MERSGEKTRLLVERDRRRSGLRGTTAERHARYATCRFLGTIGDGSASSEVTEILDMHDGTTRCHELLELA